MIDSPAIVAAFLDLYHRDSVDGRVRTLEEYRERFPGHEVAVERAWKQLVHLQSVSGGAGAGLGEELPAGATIGRYTLVRRLGEGGQGAVYLAEDPKLKRRVALKVLSKLGALTPERLERFRREAEIASRLDHPGICTVHETDTVSGLPFVVMRYVDGESLADRIEARAAGEPPSRGEVMESVRIAEEAARALQAAHEAGVVHRDVKPSNILLTADRRPVLLDFGLARDLDDDVGGLTRTGDVFGTPAYMSPEQIAPERGSVDTRTDVYSLGVTLYELLTGVRPFDAATREGLFHAILRQPPPDPRRRAPAVPSDLVVVLRTALAKEPDRRYTSARAFADDLAAVRASRPIAAVPPSVPTRLVRWMRREPLKATLTFGVGALLLLSAALGGFLVARRDALQEGERELRRREVMTAVAEAYLGAPNGRLVRSQMEALLAEDPSFALARILIGLGAVGKGEFERADRLLAEAPSVAASADDSRALERLRAAILAARGREDEAARLRADLGAPRGALEAFSRGCVLDQTDSGTAEATAAFESAVLLADRPSQIFHLSYLRALFLEKRFEDAARVGAIVERCWPDSPTTLFWVAMAVQMDDPARAAGLLERAVERKPDHVDAWMILAQCLERTGAPVEATAAYETAVRLAEEAGRTDLWRHHLVRGATLFVQGRLDEALPPLELASSQQPTSAMVHLYLGRVLIQLGRSEEATAALKQALEHAEDEERAAIQAELGGEGKEGEEREEGKEGERDESRSGA